MHMQIKRHILPDPEIQYDPVIDAELLKRALQIMICSGSEFCALHRSIAVIELRARRVPCGSGRDYPGPVREL